MRTGVIVCGYLLLMQLNLIGDPQKMIVQVGIADLRCRPEPVPAGLQGPAMSKDIGAQDSQVSFCEYILGEEVQGQPDWIKVSTQTQKNWKEGSWIAYPGYILKSCLKPVHEFPHYNIVLQNLWTPLYSCMDKTSSCKFLPLATRLEAQKISRDWWKVIVDKQACGYLQAGDGIYQLSSTITEREDELREKIIKAAHLFLSPQTPYVWGGRSPLREGLSTQITGIDCSGLAQLSYLSAGLEIPRDSGPQYRAASPISNGKDLKRADLIFFANPNNPNRLQTSHVMIYVGNGYMIDSFGSPASSTLQALADGYSKEALGVRKVNIKETLGVDIDTIVSGTTIAKNGKRILLASYFTPSKIAVLSAIALGKRATF